LPEFRQLVRANEAEDRLYLLIVPVTIGCGGSERVEIVNRHSDDLPGPEAAIHEALDRPQLRDLIGRVDALAVSIAQVPDMIRGFGHVKEANVAKAEVLKAELLEAMRDPAAPRAAAE
jgi:hypothetical protein